MDTWGSPIKMVQLVSLSGKTEVIHWRHLIRSPSYASTKRMSPGCLEEYTWLGLEPLMDSYILTFSYPRLNSFLWIFIFFSSTMSFLLCYKWDEIFPISFIGPDLSQIITIFSPSLHSQNLNREVCINCSYFQHHIPSSIQCSRFYPNFSTKTIFPKFANDNMDTKCNAIFLVLI